MAAAADGSAAAGEVLCKHRGCGKTFDPADNAEGSCVYHPGAPIFHEGMKGWSCCSKRFTDFSEFLGHPGCTTGRHVVELEAGEVLADPRKVLKEAAAEEPQRASLQQQQEKAQQRDANPKVPVELKVAAALEKALAQQQAKLQEEQREDNLKVGQACTRNACKGTYQGPESNSEPCVHHPGAPVFHEGYKYWSCCPQKKTYEFDEFLAMTGCATGQHRWFRPPEEAAKMKKCRFEWFQSADHVVLTIYAKCIEPSKTSVKANTDSITVELVYEMASTFTLELHLAGTIDPGASSGQLLSTKLDLKLKKAPAVEWPALTREEAAEKAKAHTQ